MTYIIKTTLFKDVRCLKKFREYIQDYINEFILFIINKGKQRSILI